MKVLSPEDLNPKVRMWNYHDSPQGTIYGPREIPDIQIILVIKGELLVEGLSEEKAVVKKGDILFLHPGKKHTIQVQKPSIISGIHLEALPDQSYIQKEYQFSAQPHLITSGIYFKSLESLFRYGSNLFYGYEPNKDLRMSTMAKEVLTVLMGQWTVEHSENVSQRVQDMIAYIKANLHRPITRIDIAEEFAITPEHVNLIFKRELSTTPTTIINRERCLIAYTELQNGASVKEAALSAGFSDQLYFSRVFHKLFGIRPKNVK